MNIHEHQAKQAFKKIWSSLVPNGRIWLFSVDEFYKKSKLLNTEKYVLKAQIHAGGRGKAGGITIANSLRNLNKLQINFWVKS